MPNHIHPSTEQLVSCIEAVSTGLGSPQACKITPNECGGVSQALGEVLNALKTGHYPPGATKAQLEVTATAMGKMLGSCSN